MGDQERAWAVGYLEQARSDLRALEKLEWAEASVSAMLLQMVFEKLGKAALLRGGAITLERARSSHRAVSALVGLLKRRQHLAASLGLPHAALWRDALRVVVEIEGAHPQLAGGQAQLEYPWAGPDGKVCWPERDLNVARRLADRRGRLGALVVLLAAQLASSFDSVFP